MATVNLIDYLKNKQHIYEDLLIANSNTLDAKATLHIQAELGITEELLKELYRSDSKQGVIKWMASKLSDNPDEFMVTINNQIEKDVVNAMSNVEGVVTEEQVEEEQEIAQPVAEQEQESVAPPVDEVVDLPEISVPSAPPSRPAQEDYHEKYTPFKFDFNNEWKNLSGEERKDILGRVQELAKSKLSKEELMVIYSLAENPEFVLEKLMENKGDMAITIQASINSLVEKGLVIDYGNFNNLIFLTKIGVWFYSLSKKQAPIIYQENSTGVFTWQY